MASFHITEIYSLLKSIPYATGQVRVIDPQTLTRLPITSEGASKFTQSMAMLERLTSLSGGEISNQSLCGSKALGVSKVQCRDNEDELIREA